MPFGGNLGQRMPWFFISEIEVKTCVEIKLHEHNFWHHSDLLQSRRNHVFDSIESDTDLSELRHNMFDEEFRRRIFNIATTEQ